MPLRTCAMAQSTLLPLFGRLQRDSVARLATFWRWPRAIDVDQAGLDDGVAVRRHAVVAAGDDVAREHVAS